MNTGLPSDLVPAAPRGAGYLRRPLVHLCLVAVVCLSAYSNTFHVPFVLDDHEEIVGNPILSDWGYFADPSSAKGFPAYHGLRMRYVGYLTFALNYRIHGYDLPGYHAVNLAVHALNALLVYGLVLLTFRTPALSGSALSGSSGGIALFSALLFGCHPVQTQAVTYVVQRVASLATLFYLLGVFSYARARLSSLSAPPGWRFPAWYLLSFLSCVLAMKTKEIAFTLPAAIALYEFLFFGGSRGRRLLYLLPLFLTMAIVPWSLVGETKSVGEALGEVSYASRLNTAMTVQEYLPTQFRVVVTYLRLLVLPVGQNLDYDYPVFRTFLDLEVAASFLLLAFLLALGIFLLRRSGRPAAGGDPAHRLISFGIFWFFLSLSVESSVIPIADVIFEHRVYLPSAGFFIALVASAFWLRHRLDSRLPAAGRAVVPALVAAVVVLSALAYARNGVWRDSVTLWEDVVAKSPGKARAHDNLGEAYWKAGRAGAAIREFETAVRLLPGMSLLHYNLGYVYHETGRIPDAIREYRAAILAKPGNAKARFNLGNAYAAAERLDEAIGEYEEAIRWKPDFYEARVNLGIAYKNRGRSGDAIRELRAAVALRPEGAEALYNLGNAYALQGRLDEAIVEFRETLRFHPGHADAARNLEAAVNLRQRRNREGGDPR